MEALCLYRLKFDLERFRNLPKEEQLFFIRLAQIANDLRHVSYLAVAAEKGTHSKSSDERKLALHQLLFSVRLIYSIFNEAWVVIKGTWTGKALGKTWYPRLAEEARNGFDFLCKHFGKDNLSHTIRNEFGFHYAPEPLAEPLAHVPSRAAEIISGKYSANIFYTLAEEVRALALIQTANESSDVKVWDKNASEQHVRDAVIRLYEGYRPVREAFDAFANNVLTSMVKSLQPKTEKFAAPRLTRFAEMVPILFVEEPTSQQ
jgi:hypothetical protein